MDIKAIETFYKGYRFRSRLEARWAVFYDKLRINWRYEDEGYNLNGIHYLPDFYLEEYQYFIEIKGEYPKPDEIRKCELISNLKTTFLFYGEIPDPNDLIRNDPDSALLFMSGAWVDSGYEWCICKICGKIDIQYNGFAARNCTCLDSNKYKGYNTDDPKLVAAIVAARSARFEHGENNNALG